MYAVWPRLLLRSLACSVIELSLDKARAEAELEAKRNDRRVIWCVVSIFVMGFAAIALAYWMSLDDWAKEEADRVELARWREASTTCIYSKAVMNIDRWEAVCFKAAYKDGADIGEAQKLCQGAIAQCDTTTALAAMKEADEKFRR